MKSIKRRISIKVANQMGSIDAVQINVVGGGVAYLDGPALKQTLETLNPGSNVVITNGLFNARGFNGK